MFTYKDCGQKLTTKGTILALKNADWIVENQHINKQCKAMLDANNQDLNCLP